MGDSTLVRGAAAAVAIVLLAGLPQRAARAMDTAAGMAGGHAGSTHVARVPAADCPAITPAAITAGRGIFTGAGNCATCHGPSGEGTALAPTLKAHKWINISGTYPSIAQLVTAGVAQPKQHPAPMPPKGGAALSEQQVCQVAAYVFSLSH